MQYPKGIKGNDLYFDFLEATPKNKQLMQFDHEKANSLPDRLFYKREVQR